MIRIVFLLQFFCVITFGQVRLPALVSDNMVLQRDIKLTLWGWASPGEKVAVSLRGKTWRTVTGDDGKWRVTVPPLKTGPAFSIQVKATNTITLSNVVAGDVWLCAGQSNMVHYLELHQDRYRKEIDAANDIDIRQFLVPTTPDLVTPAGDMNGASWKPATRDHIMRFSVVGYFFARNLYHTYRVPIGIINASVGGTPIEAWMSEDALKKFPDLYNALQTNKDTATVNTVNRRAGEENKRISRRENEDDGTNASPPWHDPTVMTDDWKTIYVPGFWEDQGARNLDGIVWYRKEVELPAAVEGKQAMLHLGRIVDADQAYVNGVAVGRTYYQYPQRRYHVAAGVFKPGKNIIVVRVVNNGGKGGFVPDKPCRILVDDRVFDLEGAWRYKVGKVFSPDEQYVSGISIQNQPAALFNGMVAPLTGFPVKGFVWYQGESNISRAASYEELLKGLISDWRTQWQNKDLPFLYVQLPNFQEKNYVPSESDIALLREAQLAALDVPGTGMAVTIDLGEWNDIHPGNKKPIGDRLALLARRLAYGEKEVVHSGPLYQSHTVEGSKVVIRFTETGGGLVTNDGGKLRGFAVAGVDKKFVWATAAIRGDTVEVWSGRVADPVYVRYAWEDNPDDANLYNREGLPASPFRAGEERK
jgi:sialate O-acetylesterase